MSEKPNILRKSASKEEQCGKRVHSKSFSYLDYVLSGKSSNQAGEFSLFSQNKDMLRLEETVRNTIGSSIPILLLGSRGGGKSYTAKRIYEAEEKAREGAFLVVDCESLKLGNQDTRKIFETIFGNFSSFSDPVRCILLKNVPALSLNEQEKVLNFLQKFSSLSHIRCPRLIFTSNKDLYKLVQKGQFKSDLYYRIYMLQFRIPALEERKEDLKFIMKSLLEEFQQEGDLEKIYKSFLQEQKKSSKKSIENISNLKEYLLKKYASKTFLEKKESLEKSQDKTSFSTEKTNTSWVQEIPKNLSLKEIETCLILEVLKTNKGNRTHAAKSLGISLRTLRNKINEYLQKGYPVPKPQKS